MNLLFLSNGSGLGTAKSGGMTRHIEIAKRLLKKNIEITFITTLGAYKTYQAEKLRATFILVKASIWSKQEKNNFDRIVSYIISTVHSLLLINRLKQFDIVYSTSDYFCDIVPSWILKKRRQNTKWIAMIHHLCRNPLTRKGNFVMNFFSFVLQRCSFALIQSLANCILVYNTPEGKIIRDYFLKKGFKHSIMYVNNGINYEFISKVKAAKKKYDACFVGGLRASKGIFDIIKIWRLVTAHDHKLTLAIAGGGMTNTVLAAKKEIAKLRLQHQITLLGSLKPRSLIQVIKASKVFVSTSHEEGWGIAICEALACKVPVVAYKLPAFSIFQDTIVRVEKNDYENFSHQVLKLLTNDIVRKKYSARGLQLIVNYDWDSIAQKEYSILKTCILA